MELYEAVVAEDVGKVKKYLSEGQSPVDYVDDKVNILFVFFEIDEEILFYKDQRKRNSIASCCLARQSKWNVEAIFTVSYTHLTLPTIYSV